MNFVERAILGVIRKPGKTTILLLIIFILGNVIAGAVSIQQAVENAELTLRSKMSPVTTINFDYEKFSASQIQNPELEVDKLSVETIEKIGASTHVKYFDYSVQMQMEGPSLKSFTFTGVNNPEIVDMQEGLIRLVSGRIFNEQEISDLTYVALVSQEVANRNNLTVGSVVTFENRIHPIDKTQKYDFTIIGIFEPAKTMNGELQNEIYTPNRVLNEAVAFQLGEVLKAFPEKEAEYKKYKEIQELDYSTVYVLSDPMDLEAFREEVAALVPDYYTVTAAGNSFDKVSVLMKSIQEIASMVIYVAVGAAVLTMSLLITLFLRDRRQEIGIYLSLGERKFKVAGQILLEVAVVALMAITLSLFSGSALSGVISEQMLTDQIAADQANVGQYFPGDYAHRYQGVTNVEQLVESYAVSLNMTTVLLFYAIGFATVCASVLVPIVYMTCLNPKKILMGGE